MTNNYGIPNEIEQKVRKRDKSCVYCGKRLKEYYVGKGGDKATIEHVNNDGSYDGNGILLSAVILAIQVKGE